jgi:hypothetical protein
MLTPTTPSRYYWTLFWDAHRASREKREAVFFIAAEVAFVVATVVPKASQGVGQQARTFLENHRWWALGVVVGLVLWAMARENWRRVQAKEREITWLRRRTSRAYDALCAAEDRVGLLLTASVSIETLPEWMGKVETVYTHILQELKPLLSRGEMLDVQQLKFKIPSKWRYELSRDHTGKWFKLDALREALRAIRVKKESEMAQQSVGGGP